MKRTTKRILLTTLLATTACGDDATSGPEDVLYPLTAASAYANLPPNSSLGSEVKADQVLPAQFDVLATQTPVRNQGQRGTCSIFSTTALVEHLYNVGGTLVMPDFSEQFLQWSVKKEAGYSSNSEGSNCFANLQAMTSFGTVFETDWPYEQGAWTATNDPACVGDSRPTQCYTNGEPPASALSALRHRIPYPRSINSDVDSIKSHLFNSGTAVSVGGQIFLQAWGHGASRLPLYRGYHARGIVTSPNDADISDSFAQGGGHEILLVGWDDTMEVQDIDASGNLAVDVAGRPMVSRGFFLFKNSWGTDRWGANNSRAPGYGWIPYATVEQYMSATVSSTPQTHTQELCDNAIDDDVDGFTDCVDLDCQNERACMDPLDSYEGTSGPIPDNNPVGFSDTINVPIGGRLTSASVSIEIEHPFIGDLTITLSKGGMSTTLFERERAGEDNLQARFDVSAFNGQDAAGPWTLRVVDGAGADVGRVVHWQLNLATCTGTMCDAAPETVRAASMTLGIIDDAPSGGLVSALSIVSDRNIAGLRVTVDVEHPRVQDLELSLQRNGMTLPLVQQETGWSMRSFNFADWNGQSAGGTYELRIVDRVSGEQGTLNSWSIEAVLQ